MKRKIIHIDESKCTGCGLCITGCPEGAIQLIDNKARIVSELYCDGLGACIGYCPEGAITIEEREALPYDEKKVMERIVNQGQTVIKAHLDHLKEHGEETYFAEAMKFLGEQGINIAFEGETEKISADERIYSGCPGTKAYTFEAAGNRGYAESDEGVVEGKKEKGEEVLAPEITSELTHWPIQLHLIPAMAPDFQDRDILLCADCVACAYADFHRRFLRGRKLAIACPKLDSHQDIYREKLTAMIEHAKVKSITVVTMEVPCCRGLLMVAQEAARAATRRVPMKWVVVSIRGEVSWEEWIQVDEKTAVKNT